MKPLLFITTDEIAGERRERGETERGSSLALINTHTPR